MDEKVNAQIYPIEHKPVTVVIKPDGENERTIHFESLKIYGEPKKVHGIKTLKENK